MYSTLNASVEGHRIEFCNGGGGGVLELLFRHRYQKLYHSVEDETMMIMEDQLQTPPQFSRLHIPSHAVASPLLIKPYLLNTPDCCSIDFWVREGVDFLARLIATEATKIFMAMPPDCYSAGLYMIADVELLTRDVVDHIENPRSRTRGASKTAVMKLKKEEEYEGDDGEPCVVCLDELSKDVTRMPCNHVFHGSCLLRWLGNRDTCPICRHQLSVDD